MYKKSTGQTNLPETEKQILSFWKENDIFQKSIDSRPETDKFVFFEGPPTANGKPGVHHAISRTIKDFMCRYQTMKGKRVIRKAGWDTHGLPVEIEVEKKLGLQSKEAIVEYGIAEFNKHCRESVWMYKQDWDTFTERLGYWLDLENPYITYTNDYIETVWWLLDNFFKRGLVYEGHKILPYCPRCGTPLSSHEVSLGYKETKDPSIYVKMLVSGENNKYFLVWTTTPWTLISNIALAVNPDLTYVEVETEGEILILAKERTCVLKEDYIMLTEYPGTELIDKNYEPPFRFFDLKKRAHFVIPGDFVSSDDGTGIVHTAPAFGEDDYKVCTKYDLPVLQPVNTEGCFTDEVTPYKGKFVKEADPEIIKDLKIAGKLYKSEKHVHNYPFCWRCDSPLLYYARKSWYIKTTEFKEQLIENNNKIRWMPETVGKSRFGEWLENNVDWSLSRERFWGTPLNIWICPECGKMESVGSRADLQKKSKYKIPKDIDLHRPYIDEVIIGCSSCGADMKRVPEVIDCWFDSGSMPFAQYHYPFDKSGKFEENFPADFISEAIDQTRGWFYSLLAISTILKGVSSYKSVIVMDLILNKDGVKMSKSKGNIIRPMDVINVDGSDSLRWYLLTTSAPWIPTRFDTDGVTEVKTKFFGTLYNTYAFFAMYANVDNYSYSKENTVPVEKRTLLDRWLVASLNRKIKVINEFIENYDLTKAGRELFSFVLDDLSNWYVRRSRRRFWKSEMGTDKQAAYDTLYEVLLTVSKLIAPFSPFTAEELYQSLKNGNPELLESVHLDYYPEYTDSLYRETDLERQMDIVRRACFLGRAIRNKEKLKIRQPLSKMFIATTDKQKRNDLLKFKDIIYEELNIHEIDFLNDASELAVKKAKPDFKKIGPKFGKNVGKVKSLISDMTSEQIESLEADGSLELHSGEEAFTIAFEDIEIYLETLSNLAVDSDGDLTAGLDTVITEDLHLEGLAREVINRIQNMRKAAGYDVVDRIKVIYSGDEKISEAVRKMSDYISNETLASEITEDDDFPADKKMWEIEGFNIKLGMSKISN